MPDFAFQVVIGLWFAGLIAMHLETLHLKARLRRELEAQCDDDA
jgi:hypothetical protein